MSKDLRCVPLDYQHPKTPDGQYHPTWDQTYPEALAEWQQGKKEYETSDDPWVVQHREKGMTYEEYSEEEPKPEDYRPEWDEGVTMGYCVYQDVSDRSGMIPISPIFATKEEVFSWVIIQGQGHNVRRAREFVEIGTAGILFGPDDW